MVSNWYYVGNFALTGIPFFYLGHYIKSKDFRIGSSKSLILIVTGFLMILLDNYLWGSSYCCVGTVILVLGLLLWGIEETDSNFISGLAAFGSAYSMLMFLLHCPVGNILKTVLLASEIDLGELLPFAVIAVTILVSSIYLWARRALFLRKSN